MITTSSALLDEWIWYFVTRANGLEFARAAVAVGLPVTDSPRADPGVQFSCKRLFRHARFRIPA